MLADRDVQAQRRRDQPHGDGARESASDDAERRSAELAEHQHVVEENIDAERKDRCEHDRPCMTDSLRCEAQRQENQYAGSAKHDRLDIANRQIAELRIDTDQDEKRLDGVLRQQDQRQAHRKP